MYPPNADMNADPEKLKNGEESKYFVVKQKRAVPEVLLKVVEAKKLLETERAITVQEATDKVRIGQFLL